MASSSLGPVLVVGGCGFLGYEVVRLLAKEPHCSVFVISRNPHEPRVEGVAYYKCDITEMDSLQTVMREIQPRLVINTASGRSIQAQVDKSLMNQVNVTGTRNLIQLAKQNESVQALIHTSSIAAHVASRTNFLKEDAPLVNRSMTTDEYAITKAISDSMVLSASCPDLRTLCLRLPVIYGERDTLCLPETIAVLRDKKTHIQLGDNRNLLDAVYVGNAALAHLLAAKALLENRKPTLKVDGEAFFITDDSSMPFWDFQRKVWAAAGDRTQMTQVYVIPAWLGMAMAALVEYLFWILTLGKKSPPSSFRRDILKYAVTNRTYCIEKAKDRLGYMPLVGPDEGIRRGVEWFLEHEDLSHSGRVG